MTVRIDGTEPNVFPAIDYVDAQDAGRNAELIFGTKIEVPGPSSVPAVYLKWADGRERVRRCTCLRYAGTDNLSLKRHLIPSCKQLILKINNTGAQGRNRTTDTVIFSLIFRPQNQLLTDRDNV